MDHDRDRPLPNDRRGQRSDGQATVLERFLSDLFEDRLLSRPRSHSPSPAGSERRTPSPRPRMPTAASNSVIPFFSAASLLSTARNPPASPMQDARPAVFCVEDTVGLQDDKYTVGVVDRSFGHVDTHEPRPQRDYGEDIECSPEIPRRDFTTFMKTGIPPRGTVLVSWQTQLKTELIPETRLQLLDRALYVGDVVKRAVDEHMSGTVIGTKATCTLFPATMFNGGRITQNTTDDLSIRNVPAHELMNVHEFVEDALVAYDDWIGRIENIYDEVAVKLSNNSVVIVEDSGELEHDDITVDRLSVGDRIRTKKGNLRRGRWIYGAFDPNVRPEGVVVETRAIEIDVQWLARSIDSRDLAFAAEEPPATLGRDEFESPSFYRYDASGAAATTLPVRENGVDRTYHVAEVAVGDRVRFKDISGAAVKYDGTQTLSNGYPQGKLTRIARTESLGYDLNVFLVMQTHTQVTVQWQDLTITEDLSSSLVPDPNVGDDDEVWPGEIIFSKEGRADHNTGETWTKKPARVGVVQTVKSRDRIANVKWFKNPSIEFFGSDLLRPSTTGELHNQAEEVTLYDIFSAPALTRRRGDFVLVHPNSIQLPLNIAGPHWFGEVIDLCLDGNLTIRLGAAKPVVDVKVAYEDVTLAYSSDMADDYFSVEEVDESESDDASDSPSFREMWIEYEGMDGEPTVHDEEDWATEDEDEGSDDDELMPDLIEVPDVDTSETTPETKSPTLKDGLVDLTHSVQTDASIDPDRSESASGEPASFLILDTPPPANHYYLRQIPASLPTLLRRIAKEHKILQTSLPPGIFVRTWESRLDLLRVLMIGPNDTPYEHAPFIIDFHLSPLYPSAPPEAFFHSWTNGHGPVNPNLYEDGKICLSLLGTWHADERNESWNPAKSTLLQVLVSIVGLVLVKEPYYNEAGYDVHRSTPETKLSSALYTERAYFRTRGFIHHALSNSMAPFDNELEFLYRSRDESAPKLLDEAISAAKQIVMQSESASGEGEGERDGLRTVSLGALVMLKRQVEKLEGLRR